MKLVTSFTVSVVLFFSFIMPVFPQSMDLDMDSRLSSQDKDASFLQKESKPVDSIFKLGLIESREVKYTAGPDGKWFTKDDDVYEYFILHYDDNNRLVRKSSFTEGPDGLLMTKDDVPKDFLVFEYGIDGKISQETLYKPSGEIIYTGVYEYNPAGQKVKIVKTDSRNDLSGYMTFTYGHAGLIVQDAEYKGTEAEKYHKFEYDDNHRTGKVVEVKAADGGKGPDGKLFTADDIITSAKQCFYHKGGTKDREKKYEDPGPDGQWFTGDDVIQYYTVFHYDKKIKKTGKESAR